jgi:hypothetical protein
MLFVDARGKRRASFSTTREKSATWPLPIHGGFAEFAFSIVAFSVLVAAPALYGEPRRRTGERRGAVGVMRTKRELRFLTCAELDSAGTKGRCGG